MALIDKLESIQGQTSALLDYANGVTGAGDTRLGDAIRTLADGYGGGCGIEPYYTETVEVTTDLTAGGTQDIRINRITDLNIPTLLVVRHLSDAPVDNAIYAATWVTQYKGDNNPTVTNTLNRLQSGASLGASSSYGIRHYQTNTYNKFQSIRFAGNASYPIYPGAYSVSYYDLSAVLGG